MEILIFGDSITWGEGDYEEKGGWAGRMKMSLTPKHQLHNLGVRGDTSGNLVSRLEGDVQKILGKTNKALILIAIGINDCQLLLGKTKVSEKRFKENLKVILEKAQRYSQKVAFVGLTPVDEDKTSLPFWRLVHSRQMDQVEKYNGMIREFCGVNMINFIDILGAFVKRDFKKLFDDGLHPNPKGHQLIYETVKDFLEVRKIF
jgi:acyl-CoA thioesterase I